MHQELQVFGGDLLYHDESTHPIRQDCRFQRVQPDPPRYEIYQPDTSGCPHDTSGISPRCHPQRRHSCPSTNYRQPMTFHYQQQIARHPNTYQHQHMVSRSSSLCHHPECPPPIRYDGPPVCCPDRPPDRKALPPYFSRLGCDDPCEQRGQLKIGCPLFEPGPCEPTRLPPPMICSTPMKHINLNQCSAYHPTPPILGGAPCVPPALCYPDRSYLPLKCEFGCGGTHGHRETPRCPMLARTPLQQAALYNPKPIVNHLNQCLPYPKPRCAHAEKPYCPEPPPGLQIISEPMPRPCPMPGFRFCKVLGTWYNDRFLYSCKLDKMNRDRVAYERCILGDDGAHKTNTATVIRKSGKMESFVRGLLEIHPGLYRMTPTGYTLTIIDTDYENYIAAMISIPNVGYLACLLRKCFEQQIPQCCISRAYNIMTKAGFNVSKFEMTDRKVRAL